MEATVLQYLVMGVVELKKGNNFKRSQFCTVLHYKLIWIVGVFVYLLLYILDTHCITKTNHGKPER